METITLTNPAKNLSAPPCWHFAGPRKIRGTWNRDSFEQHRGNQPGYLDTKNTKNTKKEKPFEIKAVPVSTESTALNRHRYTTTRNSILLRVFVPSWLSWPMMPLITLNAAESRLKAGWR
jgi:hypothetical protein